MADKDELIALLLERTDAVVAWSLADEDVDEVIVGGKLSGYG